MVGALLAAVIVVVNPAADAQRVGNPGALNMQIVGGNVRLGAQAFDLEPSETTECADGDNNDGDPTNPADAQDLLVDFPADPQCTSALDNSEAAPGFQPKQDTTITGTIAANGAVTVPQSGIFFPPIYQFAQGGVLTVQIRPTGPGTGNLNPLTGAASLNISLRISITGTAGGFDLGSGCGVGPFTLNMTTGTTNPPPPNEPITGVPYDATTGRATVVNNSFSVPGADSCGPLGAASGPLGAALGVPAPAGVNTARLVLQANPAITKGVNASNVPSVQSGNAPLTVNFNGTGSTAVRPITSYAWDFGNGETATGPTAFTTYTTPGTYQARLTVTDADGDQDVQIRTITVNVPPNVPPSAAIGASSTGGQAPLTVNFDGTGSSDPDGSVASYFWDFGNNRTATTPTASATYTQPGTYVVTLTVTDNRGATGTTTREIVVTGAPNVPPNAVIRTVSVAGTIPLTVNLSGGNSNDPDGTIAGYAWDLGNGQTGTGAAIQAIYTEAGIYTVTLTVTDDRGATATQTLDIEVSEDSNIAPGADFVADPVTGTAPLQVSFDGSASADVDGTIASYAWNFGNGQNATGVIPPSATYTFPGTYVATLTVTDNKGAIGTATQTITVLPPPNQSPTGSITATPTTGSAPLLVQLSSAGSVDPDGAITGYSWNFGNGTTSTSPNPSAIYNTAGVFTVQLTVTDNQGATSVRSQTITVNPANVAPVPVIAATPLTGSSPLVVNVNGAGSTDPDGSIVSYSWSSGNGQTATGTATQFVYPVAGSFTVSLTVTDNRGATRTATETIVVDPPAAPADRVRLQFNGGVSYSFDGRVNGGNLRVTRDAFGLSGVSGSAPYTGPGGSSATVSVNLSRFLIFNAFTGTVTVNDPQNGINNVTTNIFFSPLASPSLTSARGSASGSLTNPTRSYTMAFTVDDRVA
jgi:PKD repeat protein